MKKLLCLLLFTPLTLFAENRGGSGNSNGEEINGNVEIIESTNSQLTLTETPSTNYTDFKTDPNGNLRILQTGTGVVIGKDTDAESRFVVYDNGTPGFSPVDFHADDRNVWTARFFNDTYGTTDSSPFRYFMENNGTFMFLGPTNIGFNTNNDQTPIGEVLWLGSNGRVGINMITPVRNLEIRDDTNPQFRLTHTWNVNYTDFQSDSIGNLQINNSGVGTQFLDNVGIGTAPNSAVNFYNYRRNDVADSNNYWGSLTDRQYNHTSGTQGGTQYALFANISNINTGTLTSARGFRGGVQNISSGTITDAIGLAPQISNQSAGNITTASAISPFIQNSGSGNITDAYSIRVISPENSGGGTITNNYGLYVSSQISGTNNYAIYTNVGDVRLGDDLEVVGDIKQTVHTDDVSNPPTDSELDSVFGIPATVGAGFTAYINDNGAGNNFYQIVSDGNSWWIFNGSKAL